MCILSVVSMFQFLFRQAKNSAYVLSLILSQLKKWIVLSVCDTSPMFCSNSSMYDLQPGSTFLPFHRGCEITISGSTFPSNESAKSRHSPKNSTPDSEKTSWEYLKTRFLFCPLLHMHTGINTEKREGGICSGKFAKPPT